MKTPLTYIFILGFIIAFKEYKDEIGVIKDLCNPYESYEHLAYFKDISTQLELMKIETSTTLSSQMTVKTSFTKERD